MNNSGEADESNIIHAQFTDSGMPERLIAEESDPTPFPVLGMNASDDFLLARIEALEARLRGLIPMAVDLRIDGVIRKVTIMAKNQGPRPYSTTRPPTAA